MRKETTGTFKVMLFAILTLSLCVAAAPQNYAALVKEVKEAARQKLKDPDSAKFRNVLVTQSYNTDNTPSGVNVCGELNAKNGFGGYTGFKKFFASKIDGQMLFALEDDPVIFPLMYNAKQCGTILKRFD